MKSVDTEVTGIDLRHGAATYFVTVCYKGQTPVFWEWDVDPLTRKPVVPASDIQEVQSELAGDDTLVFQNPKFDVGALATVGLKWRKQWWKRIVDTLLAGHLLASNQPHNLTDMVLMMLGVDIEPLEKACEKAVKEAQRLVRSKFPEWRIAKKGLEDMPSAKDKTWKFDMWLPRAVAKELNYVDDHPWWTVLRDYGNCDSEVTLPLFEAQRDEIKRRGLWDIYLKRLELLPVVYGMEDYGITLEAGRLKQQREEYVEVIEHNKKVCEGLAQTYGYELNLPKGANNKSLTTFVFDVMKLPVVARSAKTGNPSLNKDVIEHYQATLPYNSKELTFVTRLREKRQRDTAVSYMDSYTRFWIPLRGDSSRTQDHDQWYRLHPSLNPTGTDTLRWSSSNPNEQNISKKEGFNLRYMFGPAPGREWWSLDAKNIELRIPAYEAGEKEMIDLFEHSDDPPYFGSNHLLNFHTIYPDLFEKHGTKVKELYESTWYQWCKNGNFAVQYGSVESSGTADRAYHMPGAFNKIKGRFKAIHGPGGLNDRMIEAAERHGFVETIPDKTVDPIHGYPLLCTRSSYGTILPTVPLNYHVQGTAMWWMMRAMLRCQAQLDVWNGIIAPRYFMVMQVHDELVFDFPCGNGPQTNLPKLRIIQGLMEQGGGDIGIPTPVSCKYHASTWSEGVAC